MPKREFSSFTPALKNPRAPTQPTPPPPLASRVLEFSIVPLGVSESPLRRAPPLPHSIQRPLPYCSDPLPPACVLAVPPSSVTLPSSPLNGDCRNASCGVIALTTPPSALLP